MNKPLGCLSRGGIFAALLTWLLLLGVGIVWRGSLFSPGPLDARTSGLLLGGVRSHAELSQKCAACHSAPWSKEPMSDRCLACHTEIGSQLEDPATLHGALAAVGSPQACYSCHLEHRKADERLIIVDSERFPHAVTGYSLQGHQQTAEGLPVTCTGCHGSDFAVFEPVQCVGCHGDLDAAFLQAHQEAFGTGCLDCHDGIDTYGRQFDHDLLAFTLLGKHAIVPCTACHPEARSPADLKARPHDCYACHQADDAHDGQLGAGCAACHTPAAWSQATFDHTQTAFLLLGQHANMSCRDCHVDGIYRGTSQDCYACHQADDAHDGQLGADCAACHTPDGWPGVTFDHAQSAFLLLGQHAATACRDCHVDGIYLGTPQDCYACHQADDAHEGQLGADCAACHTPDGWPEVTFDHAQSAFLLLGQHANAACGDCHVDGIYRGTPQDCYACHQADDAHDGQLGIGCAACHTPDGWPEVTFDHAQTAFLLLGRHAATACEDCHTGGVLRGTPQDCYACHQADDAHDGQLGTDCAACHTPDTWPEATFDHAQSAFPLRGRHVNTTCRDCHADGIYRGTPQDCYACHRADDAHDSQFGRDCAACHTPASWPEATFDHAQSAFPLRGRHVGTACQDCHAGGVFRGTPQECRACHADPSFHAGLLGQDCAACHTVEGWTPAHYDRSHRFPINHGESGPSPCRTCHSNNLQTYGCYGCHAHNPGQIESEHRDEGIGNFANCVDCHPSGQKEEGEHED